MCCWLQIVLRFSLGVDASSRIREVANRRCAFLYRDLACLLLLIVSSTRWVLCNLSSFQSYAGNKFDLTARLRHSEEFQVHTCAFEQKIMNLMFEMINGFTDTRICLRMGTSAGSSITFSLLLVGCFLSATATTEQDCSTGSSIKVNSSTTYPMTWSTFNRLNVVCTNL